MRKSWSKLLTRRPSGGLFHSICRASFVSWNVSRNSPSRGSRVRRSSSTCSAVWRGAPRAACRRRTAGSTAAVRGGTGRRSPAAPARTRADVAAARSPARCGSAAAPTWRAVLPRSSRTRRGIAAPRLGRGQFRSRRQDRRQRRAARPISTHADTPSSRRWPFSARRRSNSIIPSCPPVGSGTAIAVTRSRKPTSASCVRRAVAEPAGDGVLSGGVVARPQVRPRREPPELRDRVQEPQPFLERVGLGFEREIGRPPSARRCRRPNLPRRRRPSPCTSSPRRPTRTPFARSSSSSSRRRSREPLVRGEPRLRWRSLRATRRTGGRARPAPAPARPPPPRPPRTHRSAERLERRGRVFERDRFALGEPRHEQRHRGPLLLARDQRLDHLGERGRAGEPLAVLPPERRCRSNSGSRFDHAASAPATCSAASARSPPTTRGRSVTVAVANRSHHAARSRIPCGEPLAGRFVVRRPRPRRSPSRTGRTAGRSGGSSSSARGSRTVSSRPGKIGNSP